MNKEKYEIRLAQMSDVDAIMRYIDEHWRKGHIMSRDKSLFMYEFEENNSINMILAVEDSSGDIVGIHGFIKSALDSELFDLWGSFWHVRSDVRAPMLGAMLIRKLKKFVPYRNRLEIGINKKTTEKIYKSFFKDKVSLMNHYYLLNENTDEYVIADIENYQASCYACTQSDFSSRKIDAYSEVDFSYINSDIEKVPYKNSRYIKRRYFEHPYYQYQIFQLSDYDTMALLIGRVIDVNGRSVFRIVDYIGNHNLLGSCGEFLNNLLQSNEYEYVDFYNLGIDKDLFEKAGFACRDTDDMNIIPNYFEPFIQQNVDIYVAHKNSNVIFCRGDGDQDRPNQEIKCKI